MEYIIDNFEYYRSPQLWLNREVLLVHWDDLDDLYQLHKEELFGIPALMDTWVGNFLAHAWASFPKAVEEVRVLLLNCMSVYI